MRLSWGVAAVVLAASFAIATLALQLVKTKLQESIAAEQFARLTAISNAVDLKFASRRTLLKTFSDGLEALTNAAAPPLQTYLEKHPSLRESFDNVTFLDARGDVVANLNGVLPPGLVNVADRDYFKETLTRKSGVISQPYRNRVSGLAQITITEPVLDEHGAVRYVISGAINLKDHNFLGELADVKFGATGFMFIINTHGVIVDLPDKSRILSHVDAQGGRNAATAQAIGGFEGTTEGDTRAGVAGLWAFKHTQETNWILGAFYPRDEAFASVNRIEKAAWGGAVVLSLLAGLVAMVVIRHQLRPLSALHRRMLKADSEPMPDAASPTYRQDEIGELAKTFDGLMQHRMEAEMQVRTILDNIPALVSHVDVALNYTYVNAHIRKLYPDTDLAGQSMEAIRGEQDFAQVKPYFKRALAGETVLVERRGDTGRGTGDRTYQAHYIPDKGPGGVVRGVFSMSFDTTALKMAQRKLQQLAREDVLTGLPNRLALDEVLAMAIARARRTGDAMAVMFLDVDRFKSINDNFGHAAGDAVLVECAARLKASVRITDTAGRLGGDEFLVVLENLSTQEVAAAVAEKIVRQVSSPSFPVQGHSLEITTSIGIAFHESGDAVTATELLKRADAALYAAKAAGRNRFHFAA